MSLTQDDLQAIRGIVKEVVDEAIDDSDQRTAAGFGEVHEQLAEVHAKLAEHDAQFAAVHEQFERVHVDSNRIEHKLDPTIERVDNHELRLTALEAA